MEHEEMMRKLLVWCQHNGAALTIQPKKGLWTAKVGRGKKHAGAKVEGFSHLHEALAELWSLL